MIIFDSDAVLSAGEPLASALPVQNILQIAASCWGFLLHFSSMICYSIITMFAGHAKF